MALTEFYREKENRGSRPRLRRLPPGGYPTAALLALGPDREGLRLIDRETTSSFDAKSGVTGAGRGLESRNHAVQRRQARGLFAPIRWGTPSPTRPEIEQENRPSLQARRGNGLKLYAASHSDEPGRTLHVLCQTQRRHRRRSPPPRWAEALSE